MRIDSNSNVPEFSKVAATKPKAPAVETEANAIDLEASAKLTEALKAVPAVRAEKIAQAKALVADPSYPNDTTLRQVANVIAANIKGENVS